MNYVNVALQQVILGFTFHVHKSGAGRVTILQWSLEQIVIDAV